MALPNSYLPFETQAKIFLQEGAIGFIEFSGATYQIQVFDKERGSEEWTFLQLSEDGGVQDSFCTCDQHTDQGGCVHLATSWLRIFDRGRLPLHLRFMMSFWNQICYRTFQEEGEKRVNLNALAPGKYEVRSSLQKKVFAVKATNPQGKKILREIFEGNTKETEETSIKFSNLPPGEIALWKAGKPSLFLRYELSYWKEVAKWMFLTAEAGKDYKINFIEEPGKVPLKIDITFPSLKFSFFLTENQLESLIPSLITVKASLQVLGEKEEGVTKIFYDNEQGEITIRTIKEEGKKPQIASEVEFQPLGKWNYLPNVGFFTKEKEGLLAESHVKGEQIGELFTKYYHTAKELLEEDKILEEVITFSYHLKFDNEWNLHIDAYIKEKGDLQNERVRFFGNWVYLPGKGFAEHTGLKFHRPSVVIQQKEVSNFISKNRSWLNEQRGYETHQVNIEAQITYEVDDSGNIRFMSKIPSKEGFENQIELGQWVYIPGEGFFQKSTASVTGKIKSGLFVKKETVSLFIKQNKEDLQFIPHFFTSKNTVEKTGLSILFDESHNLHVFLKHVIHKDYRESPLRFYDEDVYYMGEGFHKLPIPPRLPERYLYPVEIPSTQLEGFVQYELDSLKEFALEIDSSLSKPQEIRLYITAIERDGKFLFVKFDYRTELGEVDGRDILENVITKKRYSFTDAGLFDLTKDRFSWMKLLGKDSLGSKKRGVKLTIIDFLRLTAFEKIEAPKGRGARADSVRELLESITEFKTPEEPTLTGFKAMLRPYQTVGLKWLWFLYNQELSGLLCDDMGLGKTLQAIALITAVMNKQAEKKHFLIICPTSVIYHWQDKIHAFFPEANLFTFYGSNRSLEGFREEYDILLTSYGIWRREYTLLKEIPFEIAVFDEVQAAKNVKSKLHHSMQHVNGVMKIGLTGTPIENDLQELKALFDVVLPTYMPIKSYYRDFFIIPIEKQNNKKRKKLLSRYIEPFVLRRKKEEVLQDLPEKIEEITFCPLLPEQQQLYRETLAQSRSSILERLEESSQSFPYLHVFALLARLKQICDHPAVYYQDAEGYQNYRSGKWERFKELIDEARGSGQKVVVFSQYLKQLDIIEQYLTENLIGFAGIRGATVKRGDEIRRFHEDASCEVFVASLQAAGLGIDLTPASVVIHYDRWWNAARENQATDRVHRIGQLKGVQVFKMVTRGTFEEKIHAMIERKGRLLEEVVGADDQDLIKTLSKDEILELLQDVELGKEDQIDMMSDD